MFDVVKQFGRNLYYCKHCDGYFYRDCDKVWMKSYCYKTGMDTHLTRVNKRKVTTVV